VVAHERPGGSRRRGCCVQFDRELGKAHKGRVPPTRLKDTFWANLLSPAVDDRQHVGESGDLQLPPYKG
jgi:hypothetical protein